MLHQCYNRSTTDVAIGNNDKDDDSSNGELAVEMVKMEAMRFIEICGKDLKGRHVVLVVASNLEVRVCIYVYMCALCVYVCMS